MWISLVFRREDQAGRIITSQLAQQDLSIEDRSHLKAYILDMQGHREIEHKKMEPPMIPSPWRKEVIWARQQIKHLEESQISYSEHQQAKSQVEN